MLARAAGADRYAGETFEKATQLLSEAEDAQAGRRRGDAIMMPARQAVQTSEDARLVALQRQEEEYAEHQQALARQRESMAREQAQAAEAGRAQAEAARRAEEARRQRAEDEKRASDQARADAERARTEADRTAERLAQEKRAADEARAAAEAARVAAEAQAQSTAAQAQQAEREKTELREQLNVILETRETARGLIVNLSDVLFDSGSANLRPGAREKLAKIAGILLAHPGLQLQVEGHTDSVGSEGYNQRLSGAATLLKRRRLGRLSGLRRPMPLPL